VKGAFTGAYQHRAGRFEAASGGSIFLDEIGDLPISIQIKLLRVLEEKVIERVGENTPIPVDVRIITATNRNLKQLMESGSFRTDFYYRIHVLPIHLPPLRERKEDIPLLAEFFLKRICLKIERIVHGFSPNAIHALMQYPWPGNVREFKSALEFACVTCQEAIIEARHLPPEILAPSPCNNPQPEDIDPEENKRQRLIDALKKTHGNRTAAAKLLGVSRITVWNWMNRYGLNASPNQGR
jgi:transcriptional regulator with PAS, ATPase and Fis domain